MGWLPWDQDWAAVGNALIGSIGMLVIIIALVILAVLLIAGKIPAGTARFPVGIVLLVMAMVLVLVIQGQIKIPGMG